MAEVPKLIFHADDLTAYEKQVRQQKPPNSIDKNDVVKHLVRVKASFIDFFGEKFLNKENKHPLKFIWKKLLTDIENHQTGNKDQLSFSSVRALELYTWAVELKYLNNFDRFIAKLKKGDEFSSVLFEMQTAFFYLMKGYDLEITDETGSDGQKRCDLVVNVNDEKVYIECKSLIDLRIEESEKINVLQGKILEYLNRGNRSWRIIIYSGNTLRNVNMNDIFSQITRHFDKHGPSSVTFNKWKLEVNAKELSAWDKSFKGYITSCDAVPQGVVAVSVYNDEDTGKNFIRNPREVLAYPYLRNNFSDRLLSRFKSATKQIPNSGPGVVHLQIPLVVEDHLVEVMDQCFKPLRNRLMNDTQRVNCIAISGIVQGHMAGYSNPFHSIYRIISNPEVKSFLPDSFEVLGGRDLQIPYLEETGTMVGDVCNTIVKNHAAILFEHVTKDGAYQFIFWLTSTHRIRVELVNKYYGRLVASTSEDNIELKQGDKIVFKWHKKQVKIYVNDKPLQTIATYTNEI